MLGLVDSFSDKCLAFLWEQTVPHYWLTCFCIPMKMSFWINSLRTAKESLPESSIYHTVLSMTLSLLIIKDLRSSDIYPKELTISETTKSTSVASYLDLLFIRDNSNNITTKLCDERDKFGFHIVNFPFMSSNIPSAPAYGVYGSQLIRHARCCSNYSDFLSRHRALVTRFLSQGYKVNRLSNTFKKFYGRHTDLVGQYKKNVCQMFVEMIFIFDGFANAQINKIS